jgi:hypothetical protein
MPKPLASTPKHMIVVVWVLRLHESNDFEEFYPLVFNDV